LKSVINPIKYRWSLVLLLFFYKYFKTSSFSNRNFSYCRSVATRVHKGKNISRNLWRHDNEERWFRGNLRSRRCNQRTGRTKLGRGSDSATYIRLELPLASLYILYRSCISLLYSDGWTVLGWWMHEEILIVWILCVI